MVFLVARNNVRTPEDDGIDGSNTSFTGLSAKDCDESTVERSKVRFLEKGFTVGIKSGWYKCPRFC